MKQLLTTILLTSVLLSAGCRPKAAGDSAGPNASLPSWPRGSFQPTSAKALVWYQIYGHFPDAVEISRGKYQCAGVPAGIELQHYWRTEHEDVVTSFLKHPFFAAALKRELPEIAGGMESAPECTIIRGELPDSANLDYLRDVVGLVTWFLDNGGLAVLDPQTLRWYGREKWRGEVFEQNGSASRRHVVILISEDKDGLWLHTRGMRKFARPDLSVRTVPAAQRDAAINLLNRLIELQASGETIAEGQAIKMQSLPAGLTGRHAGSLDDPAFNNTHIAMEWPQ